MLRFSTHREKRVIVVLFDTEEIGKSDYKKTLIAYYKYFIIYVAIYNIIISYNLVIYLDILSVIILFYFVTSNATGKIK